MFSTNYQCLRLNSLKAFSLFLFRNDLFTRNYFSQIYIPSILSPGITTKLMNVDSIDISRATFSSLYIDRHASSLKQKRLIDANIFSSILDMKVATSKK